MKKEYVEIIISLLSNEIKSDLDYLGDIENKEDKQFYKMRIKEMRELKQILKMIKLKK